MTVTTAAGVGQSGRCASLRLFTIDPDDRPHRSGPGAIVWSGVSAAAHAVPGSRPGAVTHAPAVAVGTRLGAGAVAEGRVGPAVHGVGERGEVMLGGGQQVG